MPYRLNTHLSIFLPSIRRCWVRCCVAANRSLYFKNSTEQSFGSNESLFCIRAPLTFACLSFEARERAGSIVDECNKRFEPVFCFPFLVHKAARISSQHSTHWCFWAKNNFSIYAGLVLLPNIAERYYGLWSRIGSGTSGDMQETPTTLHALLAKPIDSLPDILLEVSGIRS